jgi:hypothetical protein
MLFRLAEKVVFIEEYQLLASLWNCLDEERALDSAEEKKREAFEAMYLECL